MKLRALYDCRNHWQWLWITGSSTKQSYEPSNKWIAGCACCQHDETCEDCPLVGYAWSRHCQNNNSYYWRWAIAKTKKTRRKYARKMVMACNRAIEDILCKS